MSSNRNNGVVDTRRRPPPQEIPFEEVDDVRDRALTVFRPRDEFWEEEEEEEGQLPRYEVDHTVRRTTRQRADDNGVLVPYGRPREVEYYRPPPRRRQDSDSDSDSSREHRRRRRHRSRSRSSRRRRPPPQPNQKPQEGRMFYSQKDRSEGNVLERTFDSSYDGLIAGVAGAAIGAITARSLANSSDQKRKTKTWKVVGGAVVGAAAFNAAENRFRLYTEEKEEEKGEVGGLVRDGAENAAGLVAL